MPLGPVLLLFLCGPLLAQAYRLATDPWVAWAPAYVAEQRGFWRQRGLEVQVVRYTDGDSLGAFRAGKVDLGFFMVGTVVGMQLQHGVATRILAEVDWSHGGDKLLVRRGAKLRSLVGSRIGIYEDSPAVTMFLAAALAREQLRLADFEVVVLEEMEALQSQFLAGRLGLAVTYEPYAQDAIDQRLCDVVATTADFPGVMPECLAVRADRYASMPSAHRLALLEGWLEAVEWCQQPQHAAAFARICVEHSFAGQAVTVAEIPALLQHVRLHDRATLRARNLQPDGLPRFLSDCVAFTAARLGQPFDPKLSATMLALDPLQQVLAPAPAPSK